jgi:hypothetical protein
MAAGKQEKQHERSNEGGPRSQVRAESEAVVSPIRLMFE